MANTQKRDGDDRASRCRDLDLLLAAQQKEWLSGHRMTLEEMTQQAPWLKDHPDDLLDLIYSEVLLREDAGEQPSESEYLDRFPLMAEKIRRQFQLHRSLQGLPNQGTADSQRLAVVDSPVEVPTADHGITVAENPDTSVPKPYQRPAIETEVSRFPEISGFQILNAAGRGGNGTAYRAYDLQLRRIVAIKLFNQAWSSDDSRSNQFWREAEASAALIHPNIVPIFQVGSAAGVPFLVMEFISGGSLAERLQSGPMPVTEAVELTMSVAQAIHYAHLQNIIHRDLKPGNILLDLTGRPRVCDFGLARKLDTTQSLHITGDVVGTPAYMPPEQARGERVDTRADVYAIGAVLYEMLSGKPPFQAATPWEILHQVLTGDVLPLRQLNPGLPRDLETICERCLEKNASRRYSSAEDVFEELRRFRNGEPIIARPLGRIARLFKWVSRNPLTTAVVSVVAALLIAVAAVAVYSEQRVSTALEITQSSLQVAETQRDVALNAMNDLVYRVHDDLQKRQASVEARAEVLQSAITGLTKIMDVAGDREDTRITMATALTRYGYILSQQGRMEEAEKYHRQSIDVADTLTSNEGLRIQAQNYANFALFFVRSANHPAVEEWANRTLAVTEKLLVIDPKDVEARSIMIQAKGHLSTAASVLKDAGTALSIRQEAQRACAILWAENPARTEIRDQLIDLDQLLIQDCVMLGQYQLAGDYVRQCQALLPQLDPESTEDTQVLRRYSVLLKAEGIVKFAAGEYEQANQSLDTCIKIFTKLADVEPNRPGFHLRLATMHEAKADSCLALNQLDECEYHVRQHIQEIRTGMELGGPAYSVQRFSSAKGLFTLAGVLLRKNQTLDAVKEYREAVLELEPILEQYNTRDVHAHVSLYAELMAGACGIEHQADPVHVTAVKRSMETWRSLSSGDPDIFAREEQALIADLDSATHPTVRSTLVNHLIAIYALRYSQLLKSGTASAEQLLNAENRCIEVLKGIQNSPDADPLLHLRLPEFQDLRSNARFMEMFPVN
ncbi:MAG: serine/threonine protein kinase [Planctomyces sp.]|nr:serine/threonine protein kinase [Planctomyces sp.]